jgi:beige protein homolog 1
VYVSKFASRVHGFPIVRHNLAPWWELSPVWPVLLAVLFGVDVVPLKSFPADKRLTLFDLVHLIKSGEEEPVVIFPEIFPILAALLKEGFNASVRCAKNSILDGELALSPITPNRPSSSDGLHWSAPLLQVILQFLLDIHSCSSSFRDYAFSPQVLDCLIGILFPIICSADPVSAETELMSKDSILTFDTGEIRIESLSIHRDATPVLRPVSALSIRSVETDEGRESMDQPARPRASSLRRASSYVLVAAAPSQGSAATITPAVGSKALRKRALSLHLTNSTVGSLLDLVTAILVDNVLGKREFVNLDFTTRLPPSFQEHQIYFVTYLLRNTVSHLNNAISLDAMVICQSSRTLVNIIRFAQKCADAIFEGIWPCCGLTSGWFLNGAAALWEFVGRIIEFVDSNPISSQKIVKSNETQILSLRKVFNRLTLFQLSETEDADATEAVIIDLLDRILFRQKGLFSTANQDAEFVRMFCYHLYIFLFDTRRKVRLVASNVLPRKNRLT